MKTYKATSLSKLQEAVMKNSNFEGFFDVTFMENSSGESYRVLSYDNESKEVFCSIENHRFKYVELDSITNNALFGIINNESNLGIFLGMLDNTGEDFSYGRVSKKHYLSVRIGSHIFNQDFYDLSLEVVFRALLFAWGLSEIEIDQIEKS